MVSPKRADRLDRLDAGVVFVGANLYRTPIAMVMQIANWRKIARELRASDGYIWHRSYWRFPLSIGLVVGFRDRASLLRYARQDEHKRAMRWAYDERHLRAGFIRIHSARGPVSETNVSEVEVDGSHAHD